MAAATDDAVVLNIGEMIDLAIGTPETGVVDFSMLHTVLHCLAQQLHVQNKPVELRGDRGSLPVRREFPQTIAITEYLMDTDGGMEEMDGGMSARTGAEILTQHGGVQTDAGTGAATGLPMQPDSVQAVTQERASTQPDSAHTGAATKASTQPDAGQTGAARATSKQTDSILIVKRLSKPEATELQQSAQEERRRFLSQGRAASSHSHRTDVASVQVSPSTEKLSLVTVSKFNVLENIVEDLRDRVYGSIPKNEDILEEVRSQTNLKAITDMWTSLNVSSRLEAAETGIAKLSSLVQDLISDTGGLQDAPREYGSKIYEFDGAQPISHESQYDTYPTAEQAAYPDVAEGASTREIAEHTEAVEQTGTPKTGQAAGTAEQAAAGRQRQSVTPGVEHYTPAKHPPTGRLILGPKTIHKPDISKDLVAVINFVKHLQEDVDKLRDDFYDAMADLKPDIEPPERLPMPELPHTPASLSAPGTVAGEHGFTTTRGKLEHTTTTTTRDPTPTTAQTGETTSAKFTGAREHSVAEAGETDTGEPIPEVSTGEGAVGKTEKRVVLEPGKSISLSDIAKRLSTVERKLKECCESVNKQDGVVHDHLNSFQDQLEYISRQVASTQEFTGTKMSQDIAKDLPGLMKLFQTVQLMQEELKQVHETALQLAAEKEDRQDRINSIIEQIEVLKTVKLDRDDMAEAMAEKADMRMLARKVSHDQFELACDDLSRGLDHALGKLNLQEALWQQALDDIQREIETKLDKMELSPVKEFFNNKLKQLQENLKQIASLRQEVEAAGAKKKLMRDLNCLSCDAKVSMLMEAETTFPISKPLPANLSMKPYLSYELDTIRKTQASNIPQRNLHDWEHIDKQGQSLKIQQKVRSDTDKHLCNRYCGGSHTMTTPAQRVARVGHFVKQWGPDVLPLSSGYATGEDGRIYKISPSEGQDAVSGGPIEAPCTPLTPNKKADYPKLLEKRINTVNAECRCMEEGNPANMK